MERLHEWSNRQLKDKIVEPNSHLGAAVSYSLKNYSRLTLFLRAPGIPLSNCECEQAIKVVIGLRNMAYFFRSNLAELLVGDIMFSLIATCKAAKVNSFHYLVALQRNEKAVAQNPSLWLPWIYQVQLSHRFVLLLDMIHITRGDGYAIST